MLAQDAQQRVMQIRCVLHRFLLGKRFGEEPFYEQDLDNLRRKDSLSRAETTEISVRLGNDSASHFEGSAYEQLPENLSRKGFVPIRG